MESLEERKGETEMALDFNQIYQQNLAAVWQYVRARVPGYHEAQDVTSEVFSRAWRSWQRYDPARGSVGAWLFRIAHHTVADWWRRRRPGGTPREVPGGPGLEEQELSQAMGASAQPDEFILREEVLLQLQRSLAGLSDREREAIALRFTSGLTSAEIGGILGMTEGAVKVMIYRAVQKLKGVIAGDGQRV